MIIQTMINDNEQSVS